MKKVFLRILLFLIIFTMLGLCNNAYAASDVFVESEQYMKHNYILQEYYLELQYNNLKKGSMYLLI